MLKQKSEVKKDDIIETDLLRKYLVFCKQTIRPILSKAAIEELQNYYVKMRSPGNDEGSVQSVAEATFV